MKRAILSYYEKEKKAFKDYDVPEKLKQIASLIMFRFNIHGNCDGMYLCNVMANQSGSGDGCGIFNSDYVNPSVAADFIRNAYKCNISSDDMEELTYIIEQADLKKDVESDMVRSLSKWKEELKRVRHDEFRESYIKKNIHEYEEKINWIRTMNKAEKESKQGKKSHLKLPQTHFIQKARWNRREENMDKEVVKNLINAVTAYAMECSWTDADAVDALTSMGVTKEDFVACGFGEFIQNMEVQQ